MIFISKKDRQKEVQERIDEVKEGIKELNEDILKTKKKKNKINQELADKSAEMIYARTLLKQLNDDLKEIEKESKKD